MLGHFVAANDHRARFAGDLLASVAWSDERYGQFVELVTKLNGERGLPALDIEPPEPFTDEGSEELDLRGFGAVIFAGGFRPDYGAWVDLPGAFDDMGFPLQQDGASTVVPGLYFVGVHFLRKRKSSLLIGVGEDAALVAENVAANPQN
jgi:putative flavoprotein involved in K+ transport